MISTTVGLATSGLSAGSIWLFKYKMGFIKSWIKIPLASNLLVVFVEAESSKQAFLAIDLRKPFDNFCA